MAFLLMTYDNRIAIRKYLLSDKNSVISFVEEKEDKKDYALSFC
jgi:hypothetical protein